MDSQRNSPQPASFPLQTCNGCGVTFACHVALGEETCWCFTLPNAFPIEGAASCLCPSCLQAQIQVYLSAHKKGDNK